MSITKRVIKWEAISMRSSCIHLFAMRYCYLNVCIHPMHHRNLVKLTWKVIIGCREQRSFYRNSKSWKIDQRASHLVTALLESQNLCSFTQETQASSQAVEKLSSSREHAPSSFTQGSQSCPVKEAPSSL